MENKKHIITIAGPSLSGKTQFSKILQEEHGFQAVVSVTTRPMRQGEVDGVDYHFVTEDEYDKLDFVQKTSFNGYRYGVTKDSIPSSEKPTVWVIAPESISQVEDFCKKNNVLLTRVFITNPQKVLFKRLLRRFNGDALASVDTYASRLTTMTGVERGWSLDAENELSKPAGERKYDLIFMEYDEFSQESKIKETLDYIQKKVELEDSRKSQHPLKMG